MAREPEEGKAKLSGLRKPMAEEGSPPVPFKSHLIDYSAFVCVTGDSGIAGEMKWGGMFPPTSFTSVQRSLRGSQTKMRCICKYLADSETRVCLLYMYAPFQRSLWCEGEVLLIQTRMAISAQWLEFT